MNRAITVGLLTLTALTLSPANAQESEPPVLKPTLQTSGLDDDDDLLDPDLDDAPKAKGPKIPAAIETQIGVESGQIQALAETVAAELQELQELMATDRASGKAELERLLAASESLEGRVGDLEGLEDGKKRRPRGTYKTPLSLDRLPRRPARSIGFKGGPDQYRWWQARLIKALGGFSPALRPLVTQRANELKTRGDTLALAIEGKLRPHADRAVRKAIEATRFGRGMDKRLDDLMLRKKKKTFVVEEPSKGVARQQPELDLDAVTGPLVLLPRVRDPLTGRVHVVVDEPLGGPLPPHMKTSK
jgi:hypothetical protein